MELGDLLNVLQKVRRTSNGFMAQCPAHPDRNPSLAIREGVDRILLYCFGGCSVGAICEAMGIEIRDLFFNTLPAEAWKQRQQARREQKQAVYKQGIEEGRVIDARREADALIRACQGQDISQWSIEKFDRVMNDLGVAYDLLRQEDEDYFYEYFGRPTERV